MLSLFQKNSKSEGTQKKSSVSHQFDRPNMHTHICFSPLRDHSRELQQPLILRQSFSRSRKIRYASLESPEAQHTAPCINGNAWHFLRGSRRNDLQQKNKTKSNTHDSCPGKTYIELIILFQNTTEISYLHLKDLPKF